MTIQFEYQMEEKWNMPYEDIIKRVVHKTLDYERCPYEAEVNVVLTDNEQIKKINRSFRQIDRPTDVLSFPMIEYPVPADFTGLENNPEDNFNPDTGELVLGDIIISVPKIMEQAEAYGHSMTRELAFLTAHSMLHLLGYDHMEEEERKIMEEKQETILDELNIKR